MGTVPIPPKPTTEPSALENGVRSAIAGHPRGAVRRILLWVVVFTALGISIATVAVSGATAALVVALIAAALLALTDQLA